MVMLPISLVKPSFTYPDTISLSGLTLSVETTAFFTAIAKPESCEYCSDASTLVLAVVTVVLCLWSQTCLSSSFLACCVLVSCICGVACEFIGPGPSDSA